MVDNRRNILTGLSDSDLTVSDPAEDVRGRAVLDRHGDEIGEVDDLMLDTQDSRIRFLRVAAGGFLGIGEKKFLVPVDAITRIDEKHVHIDQARDHVIGAPEYDPTLVAEDEYYGSLYGHYGYDPYWAPGYAYPAFPHYPVV